MLGAGWCWVLSAKKMSGDVEEDIELFETIFKFALKF